MNVVVQCFHCNAVLELDEGFRGGVCRCSACGSLLQVPRAQSEPATARRERPAVPPAARASPAKFAPPPGGPPSPGSGPLVPAPRPALDSQDLGGSSSGLGRIQKTRPVAGTPTRRIPATSSGSSIRTALSRPTDPTTASQSSAVPFAPAPMHAPPPPAAPTPANPPAHGLPEIRAARTNRFLFWTGVLLIVAVAAVAMWLVYIYFIQVPEPEFTPHPSLGASLSLKTTLAAQPLEEPRQSALRSGGHAQPPVVMIFDPRAISSVG